MFWKVLRTKFSILFYLVFYIFDIFNTWVASVKTACWWLTVLKNRRYVLAFQTGIRSKIAFYASAQHSKDDGCAQTATPHISLPEYAHNIIGKVLQRPLQPCALSIGFVGSIGANLCLATQHLISTF